MFLRLLRLGDSSRCYVWETTPAMTDGFSCGAIYFDMGGGGVDNFSITVETFQSNLCLIVIKHRLRLSSIIYLPSFLLSNQQNQGVAPGGVALPWMTRGMGRKRSRGQQRERRDRGGMEGRLTQGWIVRRRGGENMSSSEPTIWTLTTRAFPGFTALGQKQAAGIPNAASCVWDKS